MYKNYSYYQVLAQTLLTLVTFITVGINSDRTQSNDEHVTAYLAPDLIFKGFACGLNQKLSMALMTPISGIAMRCITGCKRGHFPAVENRITNRLRQILSGGLHIQQRSIYATRTFPDLVDHKGRVCDRKSNPHPQRNQH